MKTKILVLFIVSFSSAAFAQTDLNDKKNRQYCAELKDGILVVTADEKMITSDIITANGTIIQANGNIIQKDGITTVLKDGECIDTQGLIVNRTNDENPGNELETNTSENPE